MKEHKETHDSYGMIGVSRVHGTTRNLFGSSVKHHNSIQVTIKQATKERDLNRDYYYGGKQLIQVEMSPTQFAEMITSMNVGDEVPCTLRYHNNHKPIPNPPEIKQRQIFEDEFEEHIKTIERLCTKEAKDVEAILLKKGPITVTDRKVAFNYTSKLMRTLTDSIPFLQKSFNEAMDKTVNEAKGEVEAFIMNKITSLGIEKMKDDLIQLQETTERR